MTTSKGVDSLIHMKATELLRRRIPYSDVSFAELVLWQLPAPLAGSAHTYKYRLAYVVRGVCVLRYDNESGKGDHRHFRGRQSGYTLVRSKLKERIAGLPCSSSAASCWKRTKTIWHHGQEPTPRGWSPNWGEKLRKWKSRHTMRNETLETCNL